MAILSKALVFQLNQVGIRIGYWLDKAPLKRSNSKMNQVGMQVGYFLDQAPVKRLNSQMNQVGMPGWLSARSKSPL